MHKVISVDGKVISADGRVISADGTSIVTETAGSGPAVVLVGGAFNDRTTVAALAEALAPEFTTIRYDRRGRGDSGDTAPWAPEREFEDLAAVIAGAGGPAAVVGHSSGAVLAMLAVAAGVPVTRLVAYEPPWTVPAGRRGSTDLAGRISAAVAAGRPGDAAALFLAEAAGVPAPVIEQMRGSDEWGWFERFAGSLPYDVRLSDQVHGVPAAELGRIAVPTLVVDGADSSPEMRAAAAGAAAAVPGARYETLPGEDHGILRRPAALVPLLRDFLR
jgi:pimeloyl-ACP methyl ester carboxylesterase